MGNLLVRYALGMIATRFACYDLSDEFLFRRRLMHTLDIGWSEKLKRKVHRWL